MRKKAAGSALLFCLVLLLTFTLLGVALASDLQLQSRIQSNEAARNISERSADAALSWGEQWLFSLEAGQIPVPCPDSCGPTDPVWKTTAVPGDPAQASLAWWRKHALAAGADPAHPESPPAPGAGDGYWLVTELEVPQPYLDMLAHPSRYYRVLALGTGPREEAVSVTESIVIRPWPPGIEPDTLPREVASPHFCQRADITPCGRAAWRQRR